MSKTSPVILWADSRLYSPWVLSVWTVLQEKGIPFELKTVDLRDEATRTQYRKQIFTGKIPSLQHGDLRVGESLAIIEYLEEVFPAPQHPSLFASQPSDRAHDREIISWIRSDLTEIRRCMPFEGFFEKMEAPALTAKAVEEIHKVAKVADRRAAGLRNTATPSIADFELAFMLQRPLHYEYSLAEFPAVVSYAQALWGRPSVQSWLNHQRPLYNP